MSESDIVIEEENEEDEHVVFTEFDIATYPSDLTLSGLHELWTDGDIVIPPYQRKFVWSPKQSSLLIESLLLGLPVPQVFLYVDDDNKSLVIDGQQRIMSIVYFFDGLFGEENQSGKQRVFRLSGLNKTSPYYNKKFTDLSESDQRKLKKRVLRAVNIKQMTPIGESTSQYHIFERLNTGGTPLRPQEIRNCVYSGELVGVLKTLNENTDWRKITGQKNVSKFQRDVEFILRIFSFYNSLDDYEKPMKEFLNANMMQHKKANTKAVTHLKENFPKLCKLVVKELGEKPFHIRGPMNLAVMDSVMSMCLKKPVKSCKDLKKKYKKLLDDEGFQEGTLISTSDTFAVTARMNAARKHLLK